jgi:hypothetical protein
LSTNTVEPFASLQSWDRLFAKEHALRTAARDDVVHSNRFVREFRQLNHSTEARSA